MKSVQNRRSSKMWWVKGSLIKEKSEASSFNSLRHLRHFECIANDS